MHQLADSPMAVWRSPQDDAEQSRAVSAQVPTPVVSFVIPVFNGGGSIAGVVTEIHAEFVRSRITAFEFVLVNDGSVDDSESVCLALADQFRGITYVQLDGNFGEHGAVLAGLAHARGRYICVMDDDGQNSPGDALRMLSFLKQHQHDVVYARYPKRQHSMFRVVGSIFNDWIATFLLGKPPRLYLSSFKVMTRNIALRLCEHRSSKPYLDALVLNLTRNIGQLTAEHRQRWTGQSGYTIPKLIDLWFSMVLGARITRLHAAAACGAVGVTSIVLLAVAAFTNWVFFTPRASETITSLAAAGAVIAAVQTVALGVLGRYLRKAIAQRQASPPYVLRYVRCPEDRTTPRMADQAGGRLMAEASPC